MSDKLVNATAVLCGLLEQPKPTINGASLLGGEFGEGGHELVRERIMVLEPALSYVTCPDCGVEIARVVRPVGVDQVLLYCDECGEVSNRRELLLTYKVSLRRLIERLADSLGLPSTSRKVIDNDISWRLGIQEHKHGKAQTWYFARHLDDPSVAQRLRDQIRSDQALQAAKIITSTQVPLPEGSSLTDFTVLNLAAVARLSQSRFIFYVERSEIPAQAVKGENPPQNSLIHVRDESVAFVDGVRHPLEPMQVKILLALMEDFDHRLEANQIRDKCGSQADRFTPIKYFGRNPLVYHRFIHYLQGDGEYELQISEEDRSWLR